MASLASKQLGASLGMNPPFIQIVQEQLAKFLGPDGRLQFPRLFSPAGRQQLYGWLRANRRVSSLLATVALSSSVPVLFFVGYAIATLATHLGTALMIYGFWMACGLAFLFPAVTISAILGVCAWSFGLCTSVIFSWGVERLIRVIGNLVRTFFPDTYSRFLDYLDYLAENEGEFNNDDDDDGGDDDDGDEREDISVQPDRKTTKVITITFPKAGGHPQVNGTPLEQKPQPEQKPQLEQKPQSEQKPQPEPSEAIYAKSLSAAPVDIAGSVSSGNSRKQSALRRVTRVRGRSAPPGKYNPNAPAPPGFATRPPIPPKPTCPPPIFSQLPTPPPTPPKPAGPTSAPKPASPMPTIAESTSPCSLSSKALTSTAPASSGDSQSGGKKHLSDEQLLKRAKFAEHQLRQEQLAGATDLYSILTLMSPPCNVEYPSDGEEFA